MKVEAATMKHLSDWIFLSSFLVLTGILVRPAAGTSSLVYHAEENKNITLPCISMVPPDKTPDLLQIYLITVNPWRRIYLYDSRVGDPYTDESYRGRLQCDPQLIRKGQIECLLEDVRLSDAGTYLCVVIADRRRNQTKYEVRVTATKFQTLDPPSKPGDRGRVGLFIALGCFIMVLVVLVVLLCEKKNSKKKIKLYFIKLLSG